MGLLDKAKEMKKEEGAEAPEPEATEKTSPDSEKKVESSPEKKLVKKKKSGKKKLVEPTGKKKKKSSGKKFAPAKKKAAPKKKKATKPKKEKPEPVEPQIEGLPDDLEFATPFSRIISQLVDGVLLAFILGFLGIILLITIEDAGLFIVLGIYFVLPGIYFLMMEGNGGQTFGKRMGHVKIISLTGRPLSPKTYWKSAIWKGLLYPFLNILDGLGGVFVLHKDSRQRISQYNDDLIVIAVAKKTLKFGLAEEEEAEDEGEVEAPEGGDQEGSDFVMDEPKTEDAQ